MTAFNIVRFRVKAGRDEEFLKAHREMTTAWPGAVRFSLVKTGEHTYCIVGEWDSFANIVAARPMMVGLLDRFRNTLEDMGMGMGLTDPISGSVIVEKKMGAKSRGSKKRKASAKKSPKKKAKKKSRRR